MKLKKNVLKKVHACRSSDMTHTTHPIQPLYYITIYTSVYVFFKKRSEHQKARLCFSTSFFNKNVVFKNHNLFPC